MPSIYEKDRSATREQIVAAADSLFYQFGFDHTSFADIATKVKISRGNFYYHFKTKNDILDAVIQRRLDNTRSMLRQWERESEQPQQRIRSFIHILLTNGSKIKRWGCPVGSLTTELGKLQHPAKGEANRLFTLFREWLRAQFKQLGFKQQADQLALHLLARSQGVATLANAFGDDKFVRREVNQMCEWLEQLSAG